MENMKMSEVFNLPLKIVEPVTTTRGGWPVISASVEGESIRGNIGKFEIKKGPYTGTDKYLDLELAKKMANGAAHAINNHDRLVEENARLKDEKAKLLQLSERVVLPALTLAKQDYPLSSIAVMALTDWESYIDSIRECPFGQ